MSYVSVDDAAKAVVRAGCGALLAKADIRSAYWIVDVHSEDRLLLSMQFDGCIFVDTVLPLGLLIFNAIADVLEWVACQAGIETIFHYLDDFLKVGHPATS